MPRARLSIELPEGPWIGRLSRAHPGTRFRVLAALATDDERGVGLVEIESDDLRAVVADLEAVDGVEGIDVLEAADERAIIQFETSNPLLLLSAREAGLPFRPPVTIVDGSARIEVTATGDRLAEFAGQLEAFGMSLDVERVYPDVDPASVLTDRQRRLVAAALEHGYYETPRECSLTELAAELGIAQSTASETLHRAEGAIVRAFFGDLDGDGDDD